MLERVLLCVPERVFITCTSLMTFVLLNVTMAAAAVEAATSTLSQQQHQSDETTTEAAHEGGGGGKTDQDAQQQEVEKHNALPTASAPHRVVRERMPVVAVSAEGKYLEEKVWPTLKVSMRI